MYKMIFFRIKEMQAQYINIYVQDIKIKMYKL